ncbi:helix-turn-helix domain-containing protein [Methylobacterium oryzihabitans]|nr:helix-turn-helix transcriptional regulator [Methylobacterium oryzihabitans]
MSIADRVRSARRARRISIAELAGRIGVSSNQISKYESGHNSISAGLLWSIASALQTPIEYFFPEPERGAPAVETETGDARAQLVAAFDRIADPALRDHLVALALALADRNG